MDSLYQDMCSSYGYQLNVKKDSSAYRKWRSMLDAQLARSKNYATKPEECYRLLSGAPIDEEYERSENIAPPDRKRVNHNLQIL